MHQTKVRRSDAKKIMEMKTQGARKEDHNRKGTVEDFYW